MLAKTITLIKFIEHIWNNVYPITLQDWNYAVAGFILCELFQYIFSRTVTFNILDNKSIKPPRDIILPVKLQVII